MSTDYLGFRFGFLSRCADRGLDAAASTQLATQFLQHCKQAGPLGAGVAGAVGSKLLSYGENLASRGTNTLSSAIPYMLGLGVPLAIGAPIAAGVTLGGAAGMLHGLEGESEEETRQRQLLQAYREGKRRLSMPRKP